MLKLVLVGCGDCQKLKEYIRMLQNDFQHFAKQYDFLIYSTNKIYRSEGNLDAFKKTSSFCFLFKNDTTAEYWGINGETNLRTYYFRWFEEKANGFLPNMSVVYSNDKLRRLVKGWIDNPSVVKNSYLFDLKIKYQYIKGNDKDICLVEFALNNSIFYPTPEEVFKNIIIKMDELFPDVFISSYVTDEQTDIGDAHYQTYHYNFDLLDSKILYVGYMIYISGKIEKENRFERKDDLKQYTAIALSNGTIYMHKRTIVKHQDLSASEKLIFDKLLIPQYRVFNWSDLCNQKMFSTSVCELISVYYDKYSPNDPTVTFSYGYSPNQLDELPMLYDLMCQERCTVEEFLK